ncbi:hypothetical protein BC941DRAFT_234967 [Chlamydoabsidia padenii]|nr:hypothetical protein BC941DRAFT_234967 [Chlamydoabsidia padenii]
MTDSFSQPAAIKRHTSRFTEHFDLIPPATAFEPFILDTNSINLDIKSLRSLNISASTPFTIAKPVRMHSSPAITTNATDPLNTGGISSSSSSSSTTTTTRSPDSNYLVSNSCFGESIPGNNDNGLTPIADLPTLVGSTSTSVTARKTPQQPPVSLLYKDYASSSSTSFNRADMMIKRLCNWLVFLKLVTGWMDEIVNMTGSSAFKKQKKEHPELYDYINKKRKKCQGIISSFKKECRDKLHALKTNPALNMEELLLRAKETRKRMLYLDKLCEYADDPKRPSLPEMDPWLANLQVLRYLKRETAEENRLRELMVPIQQDMKELESRLMQVFTDVIDFCVEQQTTVIQYGNNLDQVLGHLLPQHTWQAFIRAQQKEWVDEKHIKKNYIHINYPNKQHTHVATIHKGVLGRRSGVLKHYHDKYYVLTHYGYLHQFKLDDKVKPEDSIYLASFTTIQPEINGNDVPLFDERKDDNGSGYTFELIYKRKKIYHFKTTTGKELASWCRALTNVSTGTSIENLLKQREQKQAYLANTMNSLMIDGSRPSDKGISISNSFIVTSQQKQPRPLQFGDQNDSNKDDYDSDNDDGDNMSHFHSGQFSDDKSSSLPRTGPAETDTVSLDESDSPYIVKSATTTTTTTQKQQSSNLLSSSPSINSNNINAIQHHNYPLSPTTTTKPTIGRHHDHSGIYSSSPSASLSSASLSSSTEVITSTPLNTPGYSTPPSPPRRGIPTYQANLNLMGITTMGSYHHS